jgi:hypothetical protein
MAALQAPFGLKSRPATDSGGFDKRGEYPGGTAVTLPLLVLLTATLLLLLLLLLLLTVA